MGMGSYTCSAVLGQRRNETHDDVGVLPTHIHTEQGSGTNISTASMQFSIILSDLVPVF